jgi:hypothetical protein
VGKDLRHVEMTKEREGDDVRDDEQLTQLAFTLLPSVASRQQLADPLTGREAFHHLDVEMRAEFAFLGNLR